MLTSYEIFLKMPGVWAFHRTLNNILEQKLSGIVTGIAKFTPVKDQSNLLHYLETGVFVTESGTQHHVSKEYFFAYNDTTKHIEKYFAQNGTKAGLFYVLSKDLTGEHLCIKDNYKANYSYPKDDFKEFTLKYEVSGPQKNYSSITRYTI